jgi:hypothetical protein
MSFCPTERPLAVRSVRTLDRVAKLLESIENEWSDVDEYLRGQFEDQRRLIDALKADVVETYPGRKKKAAA